MKKLSLFFLIVLMLFSSAYSETKDPFYDQTFKRMEVGELSFLFPETWKSDKNEDGNYTFKAKYGDGTEGGLATITVTDVSPYGDPSSPDLLDTIYPALSSEIKSSGKVSDFTIYFAEYNNAPVYYANYYLTIQYKKHPTAVVLYVQDGNLISFTLSDEDENLDTVTNRAIAMFCTMQVKDSNSQPEVSVSHIYDNAQILPVYNGIRTEVIGEVSLVYATSAECTDEVLADWYFNHVSINDYNWCMILYSDRNDGSGVYASGSLIQKDVMFEQDENGDYSVCSSSDAALYVPDGNKIVAL